MAYVITSLCERAGLCVDVCPTDSIHFVEGDSEWPTYYINPETPVSIVALAQPSVRTRRFSRKMTCLQSMSSLSRSIRPSTPRAPVRIWSSRFNLVNNRKGQGPRTRIVGLGVFLIM